jgi:regulator of CtrA degradation
MSVPDCVSSSKSERSNEGGVAISFGERFQASEQFDAVFKEGMGLVERAASYLDGPGRAEAKLLKPPTSMLYATESMRLTTRLLEMASWLLIRRAAKEGEITAEEAEKKRQRLKLKSLGRPSHVRSFDELPSGLRELIEHSVALQDRIIQLDRAMSFNTEASPEAEQASAANPVIAQISLLQSAFRR